jgi:hypothetical protein
LQHGAGAKIDFGADLHSGRKLEALAPALKFG